MAKVMLGQKENSAPYIYIQKDPFKNEAIRITFDSEPQFNKWLEVVQYARKTDKQKAEIQRKKEEEERQMSMMMNQPGSPINFENSPKKQSTMKEMSLNEAEGPASPMAKRSRSLGKRRQTAKRIQGELSMFALATRITNKDEIDRLVDFLITHKFGEVEWHLRENLDGVNVFSSVKTSDFSATPNMITMKQAAKLFQQQNKNISDVVSHQKRTN